MFAKSKGKAPSATITSYHMEKTKKLAAVNLTTQEIQERGRALQHRFRVAGFPHYTRWIVDRDPSLVGDGSIQSRIQKLFNGQGSKTDAVLLEKCEALANRFLANAA